MKTTDNIVGKWQKVETIRNIRIKEEYIYYDNGLGEFIVIDNCDGFEQHVFSYIVNADVLYLIEDPKGDVLSYPITVDDNTLTINDKGVVKQYTRAE